MDGLIYSDLINTQCLLFLKGGVCNETERIGSYLYRGK